MRYYYLGPLNVHYYKDIDAYLKRNYGEDNYTILEKNYKLLKCADGKYGHLIECKVSYNNQEFVLYKLLYSSKRIDGSFLDDDYKGGIRDNYVQNQLNEKHEINKYSLDFRTAVINDEPDYIFYLKEENSDEIITAITEILSLGIRNDDLNVRFDLCNSNGEVMADEYDFLLIIREKNIEQNNIEDIVNEYVSQLKHT